MTDGPRPISLARLAEALAHVSVRPAADRAKVLTALEIDEATLTHARYEVASQVAAALQGGDIRPILELASVFQRTERRARLQRTDASDVRSEVQEPIGRLLPTVRGRAMRPLDRPAPTVEGAPPPPVPQTTPTYLQTQSQQLDSRVEPATPEHARTDQGADPEQTRAPSVHVASPDLPFRAASPSDREQRVNAAIEPPSRGSVPDAGETLVLSDTADRAAQALPFEHARLLELKHYVALAAELRAEPARSVEILRQFGVETPKVRAQIHSLWQLRFERNPSLKLDFEARVADAVATRARKPGGE